MKKRVLLLGPSYRDVIYRHTKIKAGSPYSPNLTLGTLAAVLIKDNHETRILDLNRLDKPGNALEETLKDFNPDFAGITFTTPLFNEMVKITEQIKKNNHSTVVIGGGAHASSLPEETLADSKLDIVAIGEGEITISEIVSGNKALKDIKGIAYRDNGRIVRNPQREYIEDLDTLPYPAWHLFDIKKYKTTKLLSKKNPVAWLETSRGCVFGCIYCNKSVFGRKFRVKSIKRVVDEIEYVLNKGFREIHIADDMFTTNLARAKGVCIEIINRKLKFPWAPVTGIRAHPFDEELAVLLKSAGCYRVYFGIESGNQDILDNIGKKIRIEQVIEAVRICKKVGLETFGFFMLALPGETESTMRDTINFAKKLKLDMAKVAITTPLPATKLFEELEKDGKISTKDWSKYNLYLPANKIYQHGSLEWRTIEKFYNLFYREFYLRPGYMLKVFINSILQGTFIQKLVYFFKTKW